eukprot:3349719-Prymnesium_polylepis.1
MATHDMLARRHGLVLRLLLVAQGRRALLVVNGAAAVAVVARGHVGDDLLKALVAARASREGIPRRSRH